MRVREPDDRRNGVAVWRGRRSSSTLRARETGLNSQRCLRLADRIDILLQARLGRGIDLQRMLGDALYRRDVLLVCDAHRGDELAQLALEFRDAMAEVEAPPAATPSDRGHGSAPGGFMSSLFDGFRPSQPASSSLPPDDPAARTDAQRRARSWYSAARWRR